MPCRMQGIFFSSVRPCVRSYVLPPQHSRSGPPGQNPHIRAPRPGPPDQSLQAKQNMCSNRKWRYYLILWSCLESPEVWFLRRRDRQRWKRWVNSFSMYYYGLDFNRELTSYFGSTLNSLFRASINSGKLPLTHFLALLLKSDPVINNIIIDFLAFSNTTFLSTRYSSSYLANPA